MANGSNGTYRRHVVGCSCDDTQPRPTSTDGTRELRGNLTTRRHCDPLQTLCTRKRPFLSQHREFSSLIWHTTVPCKEIIVGTTLLGPALYLEQTKVHTQTCFYCPTVISAAVESIGSVMAARARRAPYSSVQTMLPGNNNINAPRMGGDKE